MLFKMPTKYILESEQCTNFVQWRITKFFHDAITGRQRSATGYIHPADFREEWYWILFNGVQTGQALQQILFMGLSGTYLEEWVILNNANMVLGIWTNSNIQWCSSNAHTVYMSWGIISGGILYPYRLDISKNLTSIKWRPAMSICWSTGSSIQCVPWTQRFTGLVEFVTCKWTNCITFSKLLFDTRAQTIKSNKCLSVMVNWSCQKRSTNEF